MHDSVNNYRKLVVLAALSAAALLIVAGLAVAYASNYTFHGSRFNPPFEAADFTLTNQDGQAVHLSDYRGQLVVLYFGYTHCPDECPTTLAMLNRALGEMKDNNSSTQVLFVSVDPRQDTPPVLKAYLARFNSKFVGLTGQPAEVDAVLKAYGVVAEKEGASVSHSTYLYVIDRAGRLVMTYSFETQPAPEVMAADLEHLAAQ